MSDARGRLAAIVAELGAEERECLRRQAHHYARITGTRETLSDLLDVLTPHDVETLAYNARRLLMGQSKYGPLDLANDDRDFEEEIRQEVADIDNYRSMDEVRRALHAKAMGRAG